MCILVVDDDPLILVVAVDVLEEAGHEVLTANDALEALALITDRPGYFSCLVTDFHMPYGVTGADLVEQMRIIYPEIPMVLATARTASVTATWCEQHHVELLSKPYGTHALAEMIGRLFG